MSRRPNRFTASATIPRMSSSFETSARTTSAVPPFSRTIPARWLASPSWMSAMSTFAPSSASRSTVPPPIPVPPPVTIATFPSSLPAMRVLLLFSPSLELVQEHRLAEDVAHLGAVRLGVVQLLHVHPLDPLDARLDWHRRVLP